MKQYILLRDNKEQGPFSGDEMLKLGFKKYDLIWVEGKSAAWRYPGEIEEFKAFAPPVEEQPFDRFYKKGPAAEVSNNICNADNFSQAKAAVTAARPKPRIRIKAEWNTIDPATAAATPPVAAVAETIAPQTPRPQPAPAVKPIAVTNTTNTQAARPSWENSWLDWKEEQSAVKQASQKNTVNNTINSSFSNNTAPVTQGPPVLETKFSQSLNEIKEKYAATVLKAKNKAVDLHKFKGMATIALLAIPVMCLGVWLGHKWTAKEETGKVVYAQTTPANQAPANQQAAAPATDNNTAATQPVQKNNNSKEMIPGFDDNNKTGDNNNDNSDYEKPVKKAVKQQPKPAVKKPAVMANATVPKQVSMPGATQPVTLKKRSGTAPVTVTPPYPPQPQYVISQPGAGNPATRVKTVNNAILNNTNAAVANRQPVNAAQARKQAANDDEDNDNRPVYKHDAKSDKIDDYVAVEADRPYLQNIQDVKLSVQNVADIPLDLVVIDVEYFDAANRFKNGQTIRIKDIPAGESLNVKVPDNLNASKIRYRVSLVSAERKGVYLIAER